MSLFSPVYALLLSVLFTAQTWGDPNTVNDLKNAFSKHLISRDQYLDRLAALKFKIIMNQERATPGEDLKIAIIDDEIRKNVMPSTYGDKLLSRLSRSLKRAGA